MKSNLICMLITIVAYLILMIVVGILASKKNKDTSDFYLGGRKLGPIVTAMSAEASDMSSYLLMGLPGLALLTGFADVGWTVIGLAIGTYLNWLFVAKRLRIYSQHNGSITIPDFFSNRYHDNIMTVALVMVVVFGIVKAGGIDVVMENAKALPGYLSFNHTYDITTNSAKPYNILTICSTLAWGLGYFGMPHILLRFMAIEDSRKIKTSRRIASIWVVISMGIAILIGFIGKTLMTNSTISVLGDNPDNFSAESETVIMKIATLISEHGVVAALFAGLIFAGILACTMSTSDSQLLAASSSMSENLLQGVFGIKLSEKTAMLAARAVLLIIAVISIGIAWNPDSSVFHIVSFAWAGFGATFGPVMLCALFWKRSNKWGALAGLVAGGIMVFVWKFLVRPLGGAWDLYELLPAFIVALAAIVIVSLLTKAPEQELVEEFEAVQAECKQ